MLEIERKFLVRKLPDLTHIQPIHYERYFLNDGDDNQIRVQKKGSKYELETKTKISEQEFDKNKQEITEKEFVELSAKCRCSIVRDSYLISQTPNITIKKYYGRYEGLVRIELEYDNVEEISDFELPGWFGTEISGTELGNDNKLIKLSRVEFLEKLKEFQQI